MAFIFLSVCQGDAGPPGPPGPPGEGEPESKSRGQGAARRFYSGKEEDLTQIIVSVELLVLCGIYGRLYIFLL